MIKKAINAILNLFKMIGKSNTQFNQVVELSSYVVDTGVADAYIVTFRPVISAYTTGLKFTFQATHANTGASTINVNGLGPKTIKKNLTEDLAGGDISANQIVEVTYDGTYFQAKEPLGGTGGGTSGLSGYSGYSGNSTSGYSGYSGSGLSGYSGYSGSGLSGYSGYSGYSGKSGYSGYSGDSGKSGYSGTGSSGYSGYSGAGGISGKSGYSGYSGSGISGYSGVGTSGYSGYSGKDGAASASGYSGKSGYSGNSGYSGYSGPNTLLFTTQTNTDYTLSLSDAGAGVNMTSSSPHTLTIPTNASVPFPIGTQVVVRQGGTGSVTVSPSIGVTIDAQSTVMNAQNSLIAAIKVGTDEWLLSTGTEGISGYSGYSGKSGYSGYSGTNGNSGYSGYSGNGTSGYSGYSGKDGVASASGYSGYSGKSGYSGYSGSGVSGYSGYSGVGTSGYSGYSGTSGKSGYSGFSGYSGYSGSSVSSIAFVIDGGGLTLTTGVKGDIPIPFNCTINSVTLLADQNGSVVVDIWKNTYASYPPTGANSITGSSVPTISTSTKYTDSTLSGWNVFITAGDTLRFNVNSATTVTRVTISLKITKT